MCTPRGIPWPSTTTMHFVPLPRLVFPTQEPLFSRERTSRPRTSPPSEGGASRSAPTSMYAKAPARRPPPAIDGGVANTSQDWDSGPADHANAHLSSTPRECPRIRTENRPKDGHRVQTAATLAAMARYEPIEYRREAARGWPCQPPLRGVSNHDQGRKKPIPESTVVKQPLGTSRGVRVLNADTAGTVLWDLAPTDPSIPSHKPVIVEADAGGAIVAWEDLRGVGPRSVYAQKLPMAPTATTGMPASSGLDLSLFPNPFSNETQIRFVLPTASDVRVDVHDVRGRRVASRHYDKLASGEQSIELDWRGHHGAALSSGLYFVRVSAAGRSATRKLVVAN